MYGHNSPNILTNLKGGTCVSGPTRNGGLINPLLARTNPFFHNFFPGSHYFFKTDLMEVGMLSLYQPVAGKMG